MQINQKLFIVADLGACKLQAQSFSNNFKNIWLSIIIYLRTFCYIMADIRASKTLLYRNILESEGISRYLFYLWRQMKQSGKKRILRNRNNQV